MATRAPLDTSAAPTSSDTTTLPPLADSMLDPVKGEGTPTRLLSLEADALGLDGDSGPTSTAGRKRKLNNPSARGVANLTPEQLEKKRANDRQAQRAIRERNKTHIDALEQQVRDLSSQKPILDLQTALRQNEALRGENNELRQALRNIVGTAQPLIERPDNSGKNLTSASSIGLTGVPVDGNAHVKPSIPAISAPSPSALAAENQNFTPPGHRLSTGDQSYTESVASVETPPSTHSTPTFGVGRRDSSGSSAPPSTSFRAALDHQRQSLAHGLDFGDEKLGFSFLLDPSHQVPRVDGVARRNSDSWPPATTGNTGAGYAQRLPPPVAEKANSASSAPIRNTAPTCPLDNILLDFLRHRQREAAQGVPKQRLVGPAYPSVSSLLNPEKGACSHPVSKVFTDILRAFPDIAGLPEQVAVLYVMFLLMRWQIYSTQENYDRLPDWVKPQPSQLFTSHPAWIDYLPWPRMRDHLVANYQNYPFDNWFVPFTRTLRVNWPYEATDCLLSTGDADNLIINPVFERHLRNLDNWSLGPAFAETFPQLVETTSIRAVD